MHFRFYDQLKLNASKAIVCYCVYVCLTVNHIHTHMQCIPKRQLETVLSAYLDTNLPLPSQSLHTLYNLKTNDSPLSQSGDDPSSTLLDREAAGSHTQLARPDDEKLPAYDRRATLVNENSANDSPLVVQGFSANTPPPIRRAATMINTASSYSPSHPQRASLGNDYDVIGTPNSSIASSGASGDAIYVPIPPDTTPKVPHYNRYSSLKHGTTATRGFLVGSATTDADTDVSSVGSYGRRNSGFQLEGEELTTVGSVASLSSTSFVSACEPETKAELQAATDTQKPVTVTPLEETTSLSNFNVFKARLSRFISSFVFYLSLFYKMVLQGASPVTNEVSSSLAEEHAKRIPLSNAILALASEASRRHCPELWACHANAQLALLVLVGGGMERYMWKELKVLLNANENWCRGLYHLRHTLWPRGKFRSSSSSSPTETQRKEARREAAGIIKQFLPST